MLFRVVAPAFWTTVKTCEPMLMAPTREVVPGFAATVKLTEPDAVPDPLAVIHDWLVVAAQTQPLAVATVNEPEPPTPSTVVLVGVRT